MSISYDDNHYTTGMESASLSILGVNIYVGGGGTDLTKRFEGAVI